MQRRKVAIITTHPIQYYAPVFRSLATSSVIAPRIFYTWSQTATGPTFDPGFNQPFVWDIPLLGAYEHEFVPNTAAQPGSDHFRGIVNPALIRRIEDWGAEAVLVFGWNLHSHLSVMRHFKGRIPVLFRGDSTLLDPQPAWRRWVRRALLRWVYHHIDAAIAVGANSADYFEWCGVPTHRIVFAPHCIENARFADDDGQHAAHAAKLRGELQINADEMTFVFAGKFQAKKDPLALLDAFRQLDTPAHLVFFGDGELLAELRHRSDGHPRVHLLGFQNQSAMPSIYRLADVFVLPSRGPGETWGLALNEAMASSRAVIAGTRVGAVRDLLRDGVNGWSFESGNSADLLKALRAAVAAGREGLIERGRAGRALIESWSPQAAAAGIERAVMLIATDSENPTSSRVGFSSQATEPCAAAIPAPPAHAPAASEELR